MTALFLSISSMSAFHIFNPGHETAVLQGTLNYTPPRHVGIMSKDLACLPLWYAEKNDLVYAPQKTDFVHTLPPTLELVASLFDDTKIYTENYTAVPWGLSPQILHSLKAIATKKAISLIIPEWKTAYKELTGRQSTIKCHQLLTSALSELQIPSPPEIVDSVEAVKQKIAESVLPLVLKTPFSSSGRGVLWLRQRQLTNSKCNRIRGAIQKQGFVSLEKGLNKRKDLAMEFYSDGKGHIRYEGLSLFATEQGGAYTGNLLKSQPALRKEIVSCIGEETFKSVRQAVTATLETVYGNIYSGYLGVDMLLYEQGGQIRIHPCVEVNMRFTMGLVALRLFERYVHPEASGQFYVTFDKEPGEALAKHLALQKKHPLSFEDGRIRQGYLSLCPVAEQTNYRACLIV